MNTNQMSVVEIRDSVKKEEMKAEQVVQSFIDRIQVKDKEVKAFITPMFERALKRARRVDRKKKKGKLAGIPVAVKDNILVKDFPSTCGSNMLKNYVSPYNAHVVSKLLAEDSIIIGKTNMDEFAMGSSTENSAFFVTRNPWDLNTVPGGSSGGSAAAVASGEAGAALGSDSGGSVRQPACFCGLVGMKPTYGRVSRYGLVAFASSMDQIGPLTHSVEDCAVLTQVISGSDPNDSTSSSLPVPSYYQEMKKNLKSIRAGYLKEKMLKDCDPEVKENYFKTLDLLERCGAELHEMEFPSWEYALMCYYIIAPSEASSNLARFDGVRYGYRGSNKENLDDMYMASRTKGFGQEVKRRILVGSFVLSTGKFESFYLKAEQARTSIRKELIKAFEKLDFILTPTTPESAFPIDSKKDPIQMYHSDWFTAPVNLAGLPAVSVPVGLDKKGLPLGIQVIGNFFQESSLFKLAFLVEKKVKFRKTRRKEAK